MLTADNLELSLEGDIINYQLRIFPSKQIKQNRKLTEQTNAVNLSIWLRKKIVNINRDIRKVFGKNERRKEKNYRSETFITFSPVDKK